MQIETRSLETADTAPHWCDPLAMLIAWLVRIFDQITKMKRIRHNTKFKPNWRDHFPRLVQCEWLRDQVLAAGAARVLAGKSLYEDFDFIPSTEPPENYGGPCPRTPQEMNRRFLAVARFNADPEAAIRKHAQRIAKRAGIDLSNPLAAHGSTDAALCAAAHHEAGVGGEAGSLLPLMVSSAPCARLSTCRAEAQLRGNHEGQQRAPPGATGCARGPPTPTKPKPHTSQSPARTPPRAQSAPPVQSRSHSLTRPRNQTGSTS